MKARALDVYSDIFTGIGKFLSEPYKFQLKPNAKPMRHALRKVPIHLQEAFHKEIRNLEQLGILEPVKDMTKWVNSFVIVEKKVPVDSSNTHSLEHSVSKKLRICLDPRDLNEALKREPYYTRSIKEILGKFHGMTQFTIADFNKGVLDGGITSRFKEIDDHGLRHWKVPMDLTSNGFHHCSGCFPKEN